MRYVSCGRFDTLYGPLRQATSRSVVVVFVVRDSVGRWLVGFSLSFDRLKGRHTTIFLCVANLFEIKGS